MNDTIPNARVEGQILMDGNDINGAEIDPAAREPATVRHRPVLVAVAGIGLGRHTRAAERQSGVPAQREAERADPVAFAAAKKAREERAAKRKEKKKAKLDAKRARQRAKLAASNRKDIAQLLKFKQSYEPSAKAVAAWDVARRELFLARDHFGICPLHVAASCWAKRSRWRRALFVAERFHGVQVGRPSRRQVSRDDAGEHGGRQAAQDHHRQEQDQNYSLGMPVRLGLLQNQRLWVEHPGPARQRGAALNHDSA